WVKWVVVGEGRWRGMVGWLVEVTCYYYSMFILSAFLSRMRRGVEQWILCVAGISQLLAINRYLSYYYDDRYTSQAVLFCIFAFTLLSAYWPPTAQKAQPAPKTADGGPQPAPP